MEVKLTSNNFDKEVINSDIPVLVDFWAPWCGPCQMIAPFIEEIAKDYHGKVKICKVNVDEASDIAMSFTVMSIPTLLLFKNGKVMSKKVGTLNKRELEKFIHPYI
jgi:thioredoxin 1